MTHGPASYAGAWRIAYATDGTRYLQTRRAGQWVTDPRPLPRHVRGAYAAAQWCGAGQP